MGIGDGATRDLAAWIAGKDRRAAPSDEALALVELSVVDTIASAIAGTREPGPRALMSTRATGAAQPSSVWGMGAAADPRDAALLNGMLAHMLDFDDGDGVSHIHPSCILVPALLAVAEQRRLSGRAVLEAYLVGYYVIQVVGRVASAAMAKPGFQVTSLIGVIGGAAALARLTGLTADQTATALGIAASTAGGMRANFGTDMKAYAIGRAAFCAVDAVAMAAAGVTASQSILEAKDGFVWAFAGPEFAPRLQGEVDRLLAGDYSIERDSPYIKLYACCHSSHANITAMLRLRPRLADRLDSIREIVAEGPHNAKIFLSIPHPITGLAGKFSMQAIMATALLDGRAGVHQFTDEAIARPEVQALLAKVKFTTSDEMEKMHVEDRLMPGSVTVVTDDETLFEYVRDAPGCSSEPLAAGDISAKFRDCVAGILSRDNLDAALAALENLRNVTDVSEPMRRLRGGADTPGKSFQPAEAAAA